MIDFYKELNLNPDDSAAEIDRTLNQLESTWKRREINNPEKATKVLALILDAKNAFKSESSKSEYDNSLAESKKVSMQEDHDAEREAEFQKLRSEAETYFLSGNQKELAYRAMERALQYKNPNKPDAEFSYLCSLIRSDVQDLQGSLSDINDAIAVDPDNAAYYCWRGCVLAYFFDTVVKANGFQAARKYLVQNKADYEKGLELAIQSGDKERQIDCLESLAESYSIMYDSDYDKAEEYVRQAISLGGTNSNLQDILDRINESKNVFKPYQGKNHPSTSSGGGCYIATAVYGSYDCPEVWTLRRFRDYNLAKTFWGKAFIKCYYAVSPTVVKIFGNTKWFNCVWKNMLDKMVKCLQDKGYSSERYSDKND